MDKPLASVLVPIYNVEAYLRQCVDSLLRQSLDDIEVLLIDDGSTDASGSVADEYARIDTRIQVIHKPNSGYGSSLNLGLNRAQGTWISIVEPDDWIERTMLERLISLARAHESTGRIDLVKGAYRRVLHAPGRKPHEVDCAHLGMVRPAQQPFSIDECPVLLSLHPSIWSAIYHRDFLAEFNIRFLPIPGAGWADNPFFIETMVAARRMLWLDEAVYHYREFEDGSLSHLANWRIIADRWNEMNDVMRAYDVQLPSVLQAHACRGCAYLQMLEHDFDQDDPALRQAEREMAASLDFEHVLASPYIPGEYRRAYARLLPPAKRALMIARSLR